MLQNVSQGKTYPLWVALALTFWAVLVGIPAGIHAGDASDPAAATAVAPLPFKLPPGTRKLPEDPAATAGGDAARYAMSSGLAEATRFLDRQLTRAGVAFERIGPYRIRGIEVTRFVSQQPSAPWLAIHLIRKEGRAFLDVVARPPSARTP